MSEKTGGCLARATLQISAKRPHGGSIWMLLTGSVSVKVPNGLTRRRIQPHRTRYYLPTFIGQSSLGTFRLLTEIRIAVKRFFRVRHRIFRVLPPVRQTGGQFVTTVCVPWIFRQIY